MFWSTLHAMPHLLTSSCMASPTGMCASTISGTRWLGLQREHKNTILGASSTRVRYRTTWMTRLIGKGLSGPILIV